MVHTSLRCRSWWVLPIIAAAWLAGCDDSLPFDGGPAAACGAADVPVTCDIREDECQQQIWQIVSCLRGVEPGARPAVELISRDQLEARIRVDAEESAEALAPFSRALQLLHLSRPATEVADGEVDVRTDGTAAYYDSVTGEITIIEDAGTVGLDAAALLGHEYIHALQDREHGLNALVERFATSLDRALALRGLIEGEAVLWETFLQIAFFRHDADLFPWSRFHTDWQAYVSQVARRHDDVFAYANLAFPYPYGCDYTHDVWSHYGADGVVELYEHPPATSQEILGLDRHAESTDLEVAIQMGSLPDGFMIANATSLGQWHLMAFVAAHLDEVPDEVAEAVAEWRGDRLFVFGDPEEGRFALTWVIRTATAEQADALAAAISGFSSADELWAVSVHDQTLSLAISEAPDDYENIAEIGWYAAREATLR